MDFNRVWEIKTDLSMDERRLEEMRSEAYNAATSVLTGMPGRSGFSADGGKTAQQAVDISEQEEHILDLKIELVQEQKKMERFIASIPDNKIRIILTMRCIETKKWEEIYELLRNPALPDESIDKIKKCYQRFCRQYKATA